MLDHSHLRILSGMVLSPSGLILGESWIKFLHKKLTEDPFTNYALYLVMHISILLFEYNAIVDQKAKESINAIYETYIQWSSFYRQPLTNKGIGSKKKFKLWNESAYKYGNMFREIRKYKFSSRRLKKKKVRDKDGNTLLHEAARVGNRKAVRYLLKFISPNLKNYVFDNTRKIYADKTPAHIAAYNQDLEIVKILATHDEFDVNAVDGNNDTLLHISIRNRDKALFNFVIEQPGVNINLKNREGYAQLHLAVNAGSYYVRKLLERKDIIVDLRTNENETALLLAAIKGDTKSSILLLGRGANINNRYIGTVGNKEYTNLPIFYLCFSNKKMIDALVLYGNLDTTLRKRITQDIKKRYQTEVDILKKAMEAEEIDVIKNFKLIKMVGQSFEIFKPIRLPNNYFSYLVFSLYKDNYELLSIEKMKLLKKSA